jgi:pyridoxamine 5'-phosphate oxidase
MTTLDFILARCRDALRCAEQAGIELPNSAALATATTAGRPSVRMVLIKEIDERGFVFYTNLGSRKGRELAENPFAALCIWWPPLQEQVRVEGAVEPIEDEDADRYFATRPLESRIVAWASRQSEPVRSYEELIVGVREIERRFEGREVPRPPFWSGFRLVPERIEFWCGREHRLHLRTLYTRAPAGWEERTLAP